MHRVVVSEAAENEFRESLEWYFEQDPGVAASFADAVRSAFSSIGENPRRYPLLDDRHRSLLLGHYPFRIVYRSSGAANCLVVAIAHTSRRPGYWRAR